MPPPAAITVPVVYANVREPGGNVVPVTGLRLRGPLIVRVTVPLKVAPLASVTLMGMLIAVAAAVGVPVIAVVAAGPAASASPILARFAVVEKV